jgi:hypothetical protein
LAIEIIVHPGVDSAFIAWRAPFIDQCRDFALYRKVKRGPGSAASPNTTSSPDAQGFAVEVVASWVGFADGPDVEPGTRKPTTEWPIQKYLWSDFMVNPGDEVAYCVMPMIGQADALTEAKDQALPGAQRSRSVLKPTGVQPACSIAASSLASGSPACCRRTILRRSL